LSGEGKREREWEWKQERHIMMPVGNEEYSRRTSRTAALFGPSALRFEVGAYDLNNARATVLDRLRRTGLCRGTMSVGKCDGMKDIIGHPRVQIFKDGAHSYVLNVVVRSVADELLMKTL